MEVRPPLLTPEELSALLTRRPLTVEQVLQAERLTSLSTGAHPRPLPLRRRIASALHHAANAIYPAGTNRTS